jgi:hypothetical protein
MTALDNRAGWWTRAACASADPELFFPISYSGPRCGRWRWPRRSARAAQSSGSASATLSTTLLLAPVAYHRLVFRQHQKEQLVKDANTLAILGLAAVGLAVSASVLLVVSYVEPGFIVTIITVFVVCLFAVLWFVLPLVRRRTRFPRIREKASRRLTWPS